MDINMSWNFRKGYNNFDGVLLQEYCPDENALLGPVTKIIEGEDWVVGGSNLYHRQGDYYYIVLAEGGTGYEPSVTVRRSKNIEGPYESDPMNPILTSRHESEHPIQKAGHGSLVQPK